MDHKEYLEIQKKVTIDKINNKTTSDNSQHLVGFAAEYLNENSKLLCIGCRDGFEIGKLRDHGVKDITGIDLFTNHDEVLIMDMHDLQFEDNTFDTFFACHSLEHGNDPDKVFSEIARVAKDESILVLEVPTEFKNNMRDGDNVIFDTSPRFPGDSDFYDFENKEIMTKVIGEHARVEILKDQYIKKNVGGYRAKGILRLVLRLKK